MFWSSRSRNTPTIIYCLCVFSASGCLSPITPCCFSAMKNCLFRSGKSLKSKVVVVQRLTKVSEKRAQNSHSSAWNGLKWNSREGGRGSQVGHRREVTLEGKHFGSIVPSYVASLNFSGSKHTCCLLGIGVPSEYTAMNKTAIKPQSHGAESLELDNEE